LTRLRYIPPWSSTAIQEPLAFADNPLAEELHLRDKFVVQYSGNMGLWHDMDSIVQAAAKLADQPHIHFVFIGGGMRRKQAQELAARLELNNITWLDFFPKERLAESLTCCHAALVSLRCGLEGVAVPSKLYGILASGRAVIAQVPAASEIALVVEEERCGLVVEPGDVDALAAAIQTLACDKAATEAMGSRAFAAYQQKYTLQQAVDHFRQLWSEDSAPDPVATQQASLTR
jgi:glycosyltransferase involved in cell wall biosynthesis